MPKPYPPEFRRRALHMLATQSIRDVAAALGIAAFPSLGQLYRVLGQSDELACRPNLASLSVRRRSVQDAHHAMAGGNRGKLID